MSDCFITRRGGSGLFAFAYIIATIPADSTATCVYNQVSATPYLLDSRHIIFKVPSVGTWVVTATQNPSAGTLVLTKTVVISTQGQVETIVIDRLWVYNTGDQCIDVTGGWLSVKDYAASVTFGDTYITATGSGSTTAARRRQIHPTNPIDLTYYNHIYFNIAAMSGESSAGGANVGVASGVSESTPTYAASVTIFAGSQIADVDISSLSGAYYPTYSSQGRNKDQINEIWLTT